MKSIDYIIVIIILALVSCNSAERFCFGNKSNYTYQISKLVDTNRIYINVEQVYKERDTNDLFMKTERLLIKKNKPGIKFYSNGSFAYFIETVSSNYLKNAKYGEYRVYGDTIKTCYKSWSPQAGNFNATTWYIVNRNGLQTISDSIVSFYE